MMKKKAAKRVMSTLLCLALGIGTCVIESSQAGAEETATVTGTAVSGEAVSGAVTDAGVDTSNIKLNKTSCILMAKKKINLKVSGTTSLVQWTSSQPKVASAATSGAVKALKKGKAVIRAEVDGVTLECQVTVVDKMSKKDFGKFNGENFIAYCQRKQYDNGYAWAGQWKGDSKKKSTYRGIKIGASQAKVAKAYGDFSLTKCKAKDPFTKMKGLKRNKVKTYADMKYGKYRIRFYFNKKKKVVAIILACNIGKISKSSLSSYI